MAPLFTDYIRRTTAVLETFEVIQEILTNLVQHQLWHDTEGGSQTVQCPTEKLLGYFVGGIYTTDLKDARYRRNLEKVLGELQRLLDALDNVENTFQPNVSVQIALTFLNVFNPDDEHMTAFKFGEAMASIWDGYVQKFGEKVVEPISKIFKTLNFSKSYENCSWELFTYETINGLLNSTEGIVKQEII